MASAKGDTRSYYKYVISVNHVSFCACKLPQVRCKNCNSLDLIWRPQKIGFNHNWHWLTVFDPFLPLRLRIIERLFPTEIGLSILANQVAQSAIMTSAFLCSMLCRGLDAVWVRSIYFARELCIITALSITGAWYRNALYRLPEVWPVSVLTSPIRLRHTYTWFRHIRDGPDGLNRPWCKASAVV